MHLGAFILVMYYVVLYNSGISSLLLPHICITHNCYGVLVPFLCTSTYRTGDMVYIYG